MEELKKIVDKYYDPSIINLKKEQAFSDKLKNLNDERKMLESKITKCQNDSVKLYKDRLSGFINDEQFSVISDSFNQEIEESKKRLGLVLEEISIIESDS